MKRIISIVLVLSLALSLCTFEFTYAAEEAQITSLRDGQWVSSTRPIVIGWSTPASGLTYKLTVKNDVTGKYIYQNKSVSGSSFSIPENTLEYDERYAVWVGTFKDGQATGQGHRITICINSRKDSSPVYQPASFSYPKNNSTVPYGEELRFSIDKDSAVAYDFTLRDETGGGVVVDEDYITSSSYKVSSGKLKAGHRYKAWIGSYRKNTVEHIQFGEEIIYFTVEEEKKIEYREARIISPKDGTTIPLDSGIVVETDEALDGCTYKISMMETDSNKYIVQNKVMTNDYYRFTPAGLEPGRKYKIWVGTFVDGEAIGEGSIIYVNTEAADEPAPAPEPEQVYEEASIISPADESEISSDSSLKIEIDEFADGCTYKVSVYDTEAGDYIVRNEKMSRAYYNISASELKPGRMYKIWIGTFVDGEAIGEGSVIFVYTKDEPIEIPVATKEAEFTYPSDDDSVAFDSDLVIKWSQADITTDYELSVKDMDTNKNIITNKRLTSVKYTISKSNLIPGHQYKAWVGTFENSDSDEIIGDGDELYFNVEEEKNETEFSDVLKSHKNYNAIIHLAETGVLAGYENGKFKPEATITRAEFVKVMCEAFGIKKKSTSVTFSDVGNHWAKDYIYHAAANGIINGKGNNKFAPNDKVLYQELAKMITIFLELDGKASDWGGYPAGYIASAFYNELFENTAVETSSMQSDSYYKKNATRADVAQIVYNALNHSGEDKTPAKPVSYTGALTDDEITAIVEEYLSEVGSGRYWNANITSTATLKAQVDAKNYLGATTESACNCSGDHRRANGCTSNNFTGISRGLAQCWGFADYIEYVIFKTTNGSPWTRKYSVDADFKFRPGDLIWSQKNSSSQHVMVVYKTNSDGSVKIIEGNYNGRCHINTRTLSDPHSYVNYSSSSYVMSPPVTLRSE